MYKDPNSSSGSGASTKGDEVELVSRFLAPLCARDETARNIALAVARTTVEGWLGGVGSPNQWEDSAEIENANEETGKFKGQDGRYDMSVERSPRRAVPRLVGHRSDELMQQNYHQGHQLIQDAFRIESFFPQSVTENPFIREGSADPSERFPSGSFDCVDGRLGNEPSGFATPQESRWQRKPMMAETLVEKLANSISSDEGKGFVIDDQRGPGRRFKDVGVAEPRFSSSSESERIFFDYGASTSEMLDESCPSEETRQRLGKNFGKIKGARQKQLEDDDLDPDTRIYGKSPKFDESHGNFGPYEAPKSGNYLSRSEQYGRRVDRDGERYDRRNFNVRGRRFYEYSDETSFEEENSPRTIRNRDGVVFNTLEGFENDNMIAVCENNDNDEEGLEDMNLENANENDDLKPESHFGNESKRAAGDNGLSIVNQQAAQQQRAESSQEHYLRNNDERKFSAGQIKRPLSQDEDVSSKSGRVLEGPEVTPGDVGRMLNLGNALDGPRQAQANKYLSLVTLHLPVILRLSVNCPFQNVRIKCAEILLMVKDRGLPVPESAFDGPSAFVPTSEIEGLTTGSGAKGNRAIVEPEGKFFGEPDKASSARSCIRFADRKAEDRRQDADDEDAAARARLEAGAQRLGAPAETGQFSSEDEPGLLPLRRRGPRVRAGRGLRRGIGTGSRRQPSGDVRELPGRPLRHRCSSVAAHRRLSRPRRRRRATIYRTDFWTKIQQTQKKIMMKKKMKKRKKKMMIISVKIIVSLFLM